MHAIGEYCITKIEHCNVCVQLIPLYVCVGIGCAGAVFYLGRLATRNPDVSWNKKSNPEPWEEYRAKQYKVCGRPAGHLASQNLVLMTLPS